MWAGNEGGCRPDREEPWEHAKDFGLYPEGKGKLLKGFKPGDDRPELQFGKSTLAAVWRVD